MPYFASFSRHLAHSTDLLRVWATSWSGAVGDGDNDDGDNGDHAVDNVDDDTDDDSYDVDSVEGDVDDYSGEG